MDRFGEMTTIYAENGEQLECKEACNRQENILDVSEHDFPNDNFINTNDFWIVVKKLYWSCKDKKTKFGYKRPGIIKKYPYICPFYDKYFYVDEKVTEIFENMNVKEFLEWRKLDNNQVNLTSMNMSTEESFKTYILDYCKKNLVEINAYIAKPFVNLYTVDVATTYTTLLANIGGLLGLSMGFSIVSLADVLFCVLNFSSKFYINNRKRLTNKN